MNLFEKQTRLNQLFTQTPVTTAYLAGSLSTRTTFGHISNVDIAILRTDQRLIFDFLRHRGWMLEQAVEKKLIPIHEDEILTPPVHTIWCRNVGTDPDFLEILLNESEGDQFLFRRDRGQAEDAADLSSGRFRIHGRT